MYTTTESHAAFAHCLCVEWQDDSCASSVVVLASTGACSIGALAACQLQAHADHLAVLFCLAGCHIAIQHLKTHQSPFPSSDGCNSIAKLDDKSDQQYVAFAVQTMCNVFPAAERCSVVVADRQDWPCRHAAASYLTCFPQSQTARCST